MHAGMQGKFESITITPPPAGSISHITPSEDEKFAHIRTPSRGPGSGVQVNTQVHLPIQYGPRTTCCCGTLLQSLSLRKIKLVLPPAARCWAPPISVGEGINPGQHHVVLIGSSVSIDSKLLSSSLEVHDLHIRASCETPNIQCACAEWEN